MMSTAVHVGDGTYTGRESYYSFDKTLPSTDMGAKVFRNSKQHVCL